MTDPSAAQGSIPYASGGNPNDLHCNPLQQFTSLPASGGLLLSFSTTYQSQTTNNNVTIRMALYTVSTAGVYTLVAGTQTGSDMVARYNASVAGVQQTISTSGPLYYPSGSYLQVLPTLNYSLCFSSSALNQSVTSFLQYYWQSQPGSLLLQPYYLTQPLPNPLSAGTGAITTSTNSWQMWMTVQAAAVSSSSATFQTSSPVSSTGTAVPIVTGQQSPSSERLAAAAIALHPRCTDRRVLTVLGANCAVLCCAV
jgi:hypothetical protein